ncbi:MAG: glycosyltransferase [Proteobacteria bacterium]|nr:glycosyltransferase [Pseudomonadota bacterium]
MKEKQNYFVKFLWKTIEFITLKNANSVITVSDSLAKYVKEKVKRGSTVLYNYPSRDMWNTVSKGNGKTVCYVGNLMKDRGLEQLVRVFKELGGYSLTIIGGGKLENRLKSLASGVENITFRGVVAMERLPAEVSKYGVGVVLNEGKSKNNRWGLPNKIFQYIRTGMPFLCSDLPEIERIANRTGAGISCPPDVKSIKMSIKILVDNYGKFKKNAMKYRDLFVWERQEQLLIDLVKRYE